MSDTDQLSGSPKASRGHRRYLWVALAVVLVLAGLLAAAPTLVSTSWGRGMVLGRVNDSIPGGISLEDLSLSWLGGQSVQGLRITDAQGKAVITLKEFATDLSLVGALRSRLSLGRTVVRGLDAELNFDADGISNVARALGSAQGEAAAPAGGEAGGNVVVPVTGNMELSDARVSISAPGIEPVVLDQLTGAVNMAGPDAPIKLSFSGQTRQGSLQGGIKLDGEIANLFAGGELSPGSAQANINAGIDDLPVDALDQLLHLQGVLTAALGDRTSLQIQASGDAATQNVSVGARAPNGELKLEGSASDGRFRLASPASAALQLTPALVEAVNGLAATGSDIRLAKPVPLRLTMEKLELPLDGFTPAGVALQANLEAQAPIQLQGIKDVGEISLSGLRMGVDSAGLGREIRVTLDGKPATRDKTGTLTVNADVKHLFDEAGNLQPGKLALQTRSSLAGVPTSLIDTVLQQGGLLTEAVGPVVAVDLDADTDESGKIAVSMKLDADRVKAGPVRLDVKDRIALSQPAQVRFTMTPRLWERLAGESSAYRLTKPSGWVLDLKALALPTPSSGGAVFQPGATRLQAALSTPGLEMADAQTGQPLRIEDLSVSLAGETLDSIDVSGSARVVQQEGPLGSLGASPLQVKLDAKTGLKEDASLKAVTSVLGLDGPGLKGTVATTIDEGLTKLSLSKPASVKATITPSMVAASGGAALKNDAAVQLSLDRLDVPLAPFAYGGLNAKGNATLDTLDIESSGNVSTAVENTRVDFSFDGANRGQARLDVKGRVRSGGSEPAELSLAVDAGNLLDTGGELAAEDLSLKLNGHLQQLPVEFVDQLMNMDGLATASLGPTANIEMSTELDKMRGPVSLALKSSNSRVDMKARVEEKGLTLSEPLVAEFEPTPEFGQKVLSKIHPIFETTQRAEQPIRLEIPAEGVLVPVEGYDFSKITIPEMKLDFGKIVLKNGWMLRGITGLAQQFGKLGSVQREEWVAWFTPGVMEVKDGRVVYTRRLDLLLADKLHLATWGSADVARDQSNLTLAFMPDTMKRVFRITVAENDALRIPVKGSLSSPSVDFKGATADLARLRAQEEASGSSALAGALLGAVSGKVTGGGGPIPEASVTPLPWAEQLQAQDKAQDAAEAQSGQTAGQNDQAAGQAQTGTQAKQPAQKKSTEEQVIKGLIDMFGKKKKE